MYVIWELAHLLTKFILTLIIKKQRKLTSRSRTWSISLLTRHSWVRMYWLPKSGSGRTLALQYTIILLYNNSELRISLSLNVKKIQLCQKKLTQLKVFCCLYQKISPQSFSNSFEHLNTCHKPQSSIINQIHICFKRLSTYIYVELYKVTVN